MIGRTLLVRRAVCGIACVMMLAACGPTKVTTETSPYLGRYTVGTIAVVPFDVLHTPQINTERTAGLPAPKSAKASDISVGIPREVSHERSLGASRVPPQAGELVTRLVWDRLGARGGLKIVPLPAAVAASQELSETTAAQPEAARLPPEGAARAVEIGKRLAADAVMTGRVTVYQEREGSRIGAESAAVGLEMKLVALDGRVLWTGNYFEKQRPMTEDLVGFFQRKGAFVTAAELAEYGVEKVLQQFPY
ncbi:MAG: hypothetical protein U0172_07080 [Nitrospiraceae bacterium]